MLRLSEMQRISLRRRLLVVLTCSLIGIVGIVLAAQAWTDYREDAFARRCDTASAASDWKSLHRCALAWTECSPENGDAWLALAEAQRRLGDLELTARSLEQVPSDDPRKLTTLAMLAELQFMGLNRPLEAVETWRTMLETDPDADVARQRIIYFLAMTLQRSALREQIYIAMERHTEPREAYTYLLLANALNFSDGLPKLTEWRESAPHDETLRIAHAFYSAKATRNARRVIAETRSDPEEEVSLMDECLEEYPQHLEVLAFHIERAIEAGDPMRVEELLAGVPDEAARDGRFWRYRGWLDSIMGNLADSETAYRQAIKLSPYDWRARHELAGVLRRLNRAEEAAPLAEIATFGKRLEQRLFELENPSMVSGELLEVIRGYAEAVGDQRVVDALEYRFRSPSQQIELPSTLDAAIDDSF